MGIFGEAAPFRHDFAAAGGPATASARLEVGSMHRRRLRWLFVSLLAATLVLVEMLNWNNPSKPYASAPAFCSIAAPAQRSPEITPSESLSAALLSYKALQECYGGPKGSYLAPYTGMAAAWPESQALSATLALAGVDAASDSIRSSIAQSIAVLQNYWDPKGGYFPNGRWFSTGIGVKKFDDNAWLGLDLVRAYAITHNPSYLNQAEAVASFEATGWSKNEHFAIPGGIFWQEPAYGSHRNAVSTAGAAFLNARLYAITRTGLYKNRAEKYLHWTVSALTLKNGLIGDQISPSGRVSKNIWSYNQGLVIDTYTSLYGTTKNPYDLAAAELLAERSLTYLNSQQRLEHQPQVFDSIYLRSLAHLYAVVPNSDYVRTMQSYATYLYQRMDRSTGVIRIGPMTSPSTGWLLTQAAATQIFTMYANIAGHSRRA